MSNVILIAGRKMSGKTVFARAFARHLGEAKTVVIEQDHYRLTDGEEPACFNMQALHSTVRRHLLGPRTFREKAREFLLGPRTHWILVAGTLVFSDEYLRSASSHRYLLTADPDICLERWLTDRLSRTTLNFDQWEAEWDEERDVYRTHLQPFEHLATTRVDGQRAEIEAGLIFADFNSAH